MDAANSAVPVASSILVTLSQPEVAGQVIGKCDSILLKPFAPSLLSSRVGRLLRLQQQSRELRERSNRMLERLHVDRAKSNRLKERFSTETCANGPITNVHTVRTAASFSSITRECDVRGMRARGEGRCGWRSGSSKRVFSAAALAVWSSGVAGAISQSVHRHVGCGGRYPQGGSSIRRVVCGTS